MTGSTSHPVRSVDSGRLPARVSELVGGTRGVEELAAGLIGRRPRSRLLHRYQLSRVDGLTRLRATGPGLGRGLELVDPEEPGRLVATCTELVVLARLPDAVAAALAACEETFDRLLSDLGVPRDSQILSASLEPGGPAWTRFRWRFRRRPVPLQVLRKIWLSDSASPVALISEEHSLDPVLLAAASPDSSR